MTHCISIKNIYTHDTFDCNAKVKDIIKFMHDMFQYQPRNVIFLYKFDNNEQYLTAHNSEDFAMEKIDNPNILKILEHIFDIDYDDKEKRIESIINNLSQFVKQNEMNVTIDKDKLSNFMKKIETNPETQKVYEAKNNYIENIKPIQQGGVLIWLMEKYLMPKMPAMMQNIFFGILEIIDAILIVGISIPGLQLVAGAGIIVDIVSFIYCFLRFDIIGMVASVIALIPIIGNIIGGIMRIGNKFMKYNKKYKDYKRKQKLDKKKKRERLQTLTDSLQNQDVQGQLLLTDSSQNQDVQEEAIDERQLVPYEAQ